jgi:C-terminal processing protease CtpA/Prc
MFSGHKFVVLVLSLTFALPASSQKPKLNAFDYALAHDMLHDAYNDVKKNYYDPQYHGIDLDARYHEFEGRLAAVSTLNDGMRIVQGFLDGFKDSHTFFIAPERPFTFESGFRMQMIGDQCYVVRVRPGTDAAGKLHPGDRVIKYNSFTLNRDDIVPAVHYFTVLNPTLNAELDLQGPDGALRHESVKATSERGKNVISDNPLKPDFITLIRREQTADHVERSILIESGNVSYWRLPEFDFKTDKIDDTIIHASKHPALVLDLRGNRGGLTATLECVLAGVFDHDIKVGDRVGHKDSKPFIAKRPPGAHLFSGKLIVLVDSRSASASEVFARVIQLEHRGIVLGDKTQGAVMEAKVYGESSGGDTKVFFGYSVTDADLIMGDGKSLEHGGVTPDEIIVPTAQDLAAGRDPVMARAAALAGATLSPEDAGKLFPIEWLPLQAP